MVGDMTPGDPGSSSWRRSTTEGEDRAGQVLDPTYSSSDCPWPGSHLSH